MQWRFCLSTKALQLHSVRCSYCSHDERRGAAMRAAHQQRCAPHLYKAFLCAATLAIYGVYTIFPSWTGSIINEDAASSRYFQSSRQRSCQSGRLLPAGAKYMLYAPHSGFSNQVGELKNALLVAALLNRTLVLPPIFDHHAVALGSCPKFRVHEPQKLRALAWAHIIELLRSGRYVSIADALDLSLVMPLVKLVDLRIFMRFWCGVDTSSSAQSRTWERMESCIALLSRSDDIDETCVRGVNEDCRTTIWVHRATRMGELQPKQSLLAPKEAALNMGNQRFNNTKTKSEYRVRNYKEIVETLGNNSKAGKYEVLAFGSLFSAEYKGSQLHVDIESSNDPKVKTLVGAMKFIPFTNPILTAGKQFSQLQIGRPFFCAQLRLLDGQFKNHWEKTFTSLKSQLKAAREQIDPAQVLDVFVMTDLPHSKWNNTYLGELDMDKTYKLHTIDGSDLLVLNTAMELANADYGLRTGDLPHFNNILQSKTGHPLNVSIHPDLLLFIQEVICSCASLGFVGTPGSTLSENIVQLRLGKVCVR